MSNPALVPAMEPPPGVISNYVNPPNEAGAMLVVGVLCIILVAVFVSGRVYTKLWLMTHSLSADDLTVYGYGRHQWDVPAVTFTSTFFKGVYSEHLILDIPSQTLDPRGWYLEHEQIPLLSSLKSRLRLGSKARISKGSSNAGAALPPNSSLDRLHAPTLSVSSYRETGHDIELGENGDGK
ncbi:MAG: hypothetical protein Q9187_002125 [Circinaria calcarea]